MSGCSPEPEVDLGQLVVLAADQGRPLFWSSDDTRLYWSGWTAGGKGLHAVDVTTREDDTVIQGHDDADSPALVAQDTMLFFIADRPDAYAGGTLYQGALVDGRVTAATPIASHVQSYAVSSNGTRIAIVEDGSGVLSTWDLHLGIRQSFGRCTPAVFSPDGSRILATTAPLAGTATRFLADPLTGVSEATDIAGDVVAWDGGTPRRVADPWAVTDLPTGAQQPLENPDGRTLFYSGDPANRDAGYYNVVQCLKSGTAEDRTEECETAQGQLYRIGLHSGRRDVVAKYEPGNSISFAISQDGSRLATALTTSAGGAPSIYVKTLSPGS